jgi:hypothetical protein
MDTASSERGATSASQPPTSTVEGETSLSRSDKAPAVNPLHDLPNLAPSERSPRRRELTVVLHNPEIAAASRRRVTVIAAGVVLVGLLVAALLVGMTRPLGRAPFSAPASAESADPRLSPPTR